MSFYQKYRPQEFDSLSGQEHVKATLKSALKKDLVAHAYLFCGPRGTGKTTTARLVAKSLNCQNFDKELGEPCNECDICVAITDSHFIDVIEIDAASNRGIDEIRELKETIQFAPSLGENKVYIIDEVHMLTNEAFNALLKTLEEPPANVYFILATTEAHKIPETIISRCQRFDFKRISNDDLVARLQFVVDSEKLKFEEEALKMIAMYANGGLRDAISILDQLAVNEDGITVKNTQLLLGSTGIETVHSFLDSLLNGDDKTAFSILEQLNKEGIDLGQFRIDVLKVVRERLHLSVQNDDMPAKAAFLKIIDIWQEIHNKFRHNLIPELPLEVLIVQVCNAGMLKQIAMAPPVVNSAPAAPVAPVVAAPIAVLESSDSAVSAPALVEVKQEDIAPVVEEAVSVEVAEEPAVEEVSELEKVLNERKARSLADKSDENLVPSQEKPVVAVKETPVEKIMTLNEIEAKWKTIASELESTLVKRMLKNTSLKKVSDSEMEVVIYSDFEFNTIKKSENLVQIESLIEKYAGKQVALTLKKEESKNKPTWDTPAPSSSATAGGDDGLLDFVDAQTGNSSGGDSGLLDMFDGEEIF